MTVKDPRGSKSEAVSEGQVWLAVETATAVGSVAVWRDGPVYESSFNIQGAHSELVLPALHHALEVTGTPPDEVSAFVVGSGPGSFTGVRIAASMAKGWAMARRIPLYAYSSLLAVAAGTGVAGPVCALFDAKRGQIYGACYDLSAEPPSERLAPAAWHIEHLLQAVADLQLRPVFAGEGALAYRQAIAATFEDAVVLPQHLGVPRAASLLWLRSTAPELGRVERPAEWEPSYVRDWRVPEEGER